VEALLDRQLSRRLSGRRRRRVLPRGTERCCLRRHGLGWNGGLLGRLRLRDYQKRGEGDGQAAMN